MARLIDMNATPPPSGPDENARVGLQYVLVADGDVERAASCLEAMRPFAVGAMVARDGDEATRMMQRFGPPILLIVDLSLARKDAFSLIETLRRHDDVRTEVIAWAAFRELREFAAHRLAGLNVRVLSGEARQAVIAAAIERALKRRQEAAAPGIEAVTPEEMHAAMTDVADKARRLCGTPGVAVYLRIPGATRFRASVAWTSDDPIPHSPYYIPRVFGWILETGDALILPDMTKHRLSDMSTATLEDVIQGLVAVPILGDDQHVIGSICVFDVKPLAIGDAEVAALKALGRSIPFGGARAAVPATGRTVDEGPRAVPEPEHRAHAPRPEEARPVPRAADAPARPTADAPPVSWPSALVDRSAGHFAVARELARARREARQLSVVVFDVSSDPRSPGAASDEVFGSVGETLLRTIRQSDVPIQWGDRELLVVLPALTGTEARMVAERVRAALQAGSGHRAAVSAGVAEMAHDDTVANIILRAKEKAREARERGHNRVA